MKFKLNNAFLILGMLGMVIFGAATVRSQQNASGHANDFTSVEYFEPPRETSIKSRLSGAQAQPEAGGLLVIKQLKLETFDSNGVPGMIVKAPHCVYDTVHGVAHSPGHLRLETADGSSHIEGDGFLWRQGNGSLTISNNVRTVVEAGSNLKTGS
jgi:hypothetical protein